jgi:hypothetical protein
MHIGPFYFDTKEVFLFLAAILVALAYHFGWPMWLFVPEHLFVLLIILLITKGLLPAIHNENYFVLALFSIFLLLYLGLFQVLLFYFLSFVLLKVFKAI